MGVFAYFGLRACIMACTLGMRMRESTDDTSDRARHYDMFKTVPLHSTAPTIDDVTAGGLATVGCGGLRGHALARERGKAVTCTSTRLRVRLCKFYG